MIYWLETTLGRSFYEMGLDSNPKIIFEFSKFSLKKFVFDV